MCGRRDIHGIRLHIAGLGTTIRQRPDLGESIGPDWNLSNVAEQKAAEFLALWPARPQALLLYTKNALYEEGGTHEASDIRSRLALHRRAL
jgi:hypothetical protein